MIPWRRIKGDAVEGLRFLLGEAQAIFNQTLVGAERAKIRRALHKVEEVLQERYQEVGERICRHMMAGTKDHLIEAGLRQQFEEIERLQTERQHLLEEMKNASRMQD